VCCTSLFPRFPACPVPPASFPTFFQVFQREAVHPHSTPLFSFPFPPSICSGSLRSNLQQRFSAQPLSASPPPLSPPSLFFPQRCAVELCARRVGKRLVSPPPPRPPDPIIRKAFVRGKEGKPCPLPVSPFPSPPQGSKPGETSPSGYFFFCFFDSPRARRKLPSFLPFFFVVVSALMRLTCFRVSVLFLSLFPFPFSFPLGERTLDVAHSPEREIAFLFSPPFFGGRRRVASKVFRV